MNEERDTPPDGERMAAAMEAWTGALRDVQKSIDDAAAAIRFLRETLAQMAPLWKSLGGLEESLLSFKGEDLPAQPRNTQPDSKTPHPHRHPGPEVVELPLESAAEPEQDQEQEQDDQSWQTTWKHKPAVKQRASSRRAEREDPVPESEVVSIGPRPQAPKPVTLVPDDTVAAYSYRLSVEDPRRPLELVPLYQALNSVPAIRNLSLIGFVSGVASISVEATDEISPQDLENAVNKVMKRSCSVLPHDSNTLLLQVGD